MKSQTEVGFWSLYSLEFKDPRAGASGFCCQLLGESGGFHRKTTAEIDSFCAALGPKANGGAKLT